ncbi:MAG TPA: hypothetical protein VJM32_04095 [Candidatus Saccharimonadales bacterium]|nr:hypothetical protein [Candidatus Saccharimonadales bacterium]
MATSPGQAARDIATAWDMHLRTLMRQGSQIIALRGAGSTGGIDAQAATHVLDNLLVPRITAITAAQPVVIMYDGDPDDTGKPDIGFIAGRLLDHFGDQIASGRVTFLTAQADNWYYPPEPGSNLVNAIGRPFDTYVFPRGQYPGDHNRFTQSDNLVGYAGYSQIYVGAAGLLAGAQMVDYCNRVPAGQPVRVTIIRAMINRALDAEIGEKLAAAVEQAKREKLEAQLAQRERHFGLHWRNDGAFDPSFREEIVRVDDTHEIVVLWKTTDEVEIANCRRIDLNSPAYDQLFASATKYVKTEPVRARQIPMGQSEEVPVKSGATTDTARGGDWVITSVSGEEYKGPSDFLEVYEPVPGMPGTYRPRFDPREMIRLEEDVIFRAPWGEDQAVSKGGYLMQRTIRSGPNAGTTERYGIAEKDAADMAPLT